MPTTLPITDENRTETDAGIDAGMRLTSINNRCGEFEHNGVKVPLRINPNGGVEIAKDVIDHVDRVIPPRDGSFGAGDLQSLGLWVTRFRTDDTMVYVGPGAVVVRIDDVPAGSDRGGRRKLSGVLPLQFSARMKIWLGASNRPMSVDEFAELIEANAEDLVRADMITFVRNLEIKEGTTWKRVADGKGGIKLVAEAEQSGTAVPRSFNIAVPYYDFDTESTALKFRLTLKLVKGEASFSIVCAELDEIARMRRVDLAGRLAELIPPGTPVLRGESK